MRWRMAWAIPWLLAAALPVLLTQGTTAQEDNLLLDGGFEQGADGWLAVGGELTISDVLVRSGTSAGVFTADDTFSRHELSYCLPIAPSSHYRFAGYAARREEDPTFSLHLDISWYGRADCFGQEIHGGADEASVEPRSPGLWYEFGVAANSPADGRSVRLRIVVEPGGATAYLDDLAISGPPIPTQTPTPEPSPSPTRTAIPDSTPTATPESPSGPMTPVPTDGALLNGGFEEVDSEGRPSHWQKYGGDLARTNSVRYEGEFAAAFTSRTNSTKWVYQVVTVQGGKAYTLNGYVLKDDPAIVAAFLRVSWYASPDGSGRAIDTTDSAAYLTDDSPEFRLLTTGAVVAPAEAASAKARVVLDPVGHEASTIYLDAFTLEQTPLPEPTPEPTLSPTVIAHPLDARPTPATPLPALTASVAAPTPERQRFEPAPTTTVSTTTPSSTATPGGSEARRTTAALSAVRTPAPSATTVGAGAGPPAPALVFRERKPAAPEADAAITESGGGALSLQLLALSAGVPALAAAAGAGLQYRRWRRARLR